MGSVDEQVLYAAIAVIGGVVVGTIGGALARRFLQDERRAHRMRAVAAPAAALVFWVALAAGIAIGVGFLAPDALRPLPGRFLAYVPKALVAGLMLIVGYALATATAVVLSEGLARATGRTRRQAALGLRTAVMTTVTLLALGQLGVDTTILTIVAGALLFGAATAMALLVGLGGREMAREVAAGRYLRRIVRPGDYIETGEIAGRVSTLHPATTEVETGTSTILHVPHTLLMSNPIQVQRRAPVPEQTDSDTEPRTRTETTA